MKMRIHIDVLSRLNVVNVVAISDFLPQENIVQVEKSTLTINDDKFDCEGLMFQNNKIVVMRNVDETGIWFRLPLDSESVLPVHNGGASLHIIQKEDISSVYKKSTLQNIKPQMAIDKEEVFYCKSCNNELARIRPGRILPLPSSDWRHSASNWFCCTTKHLRKDSGTLTEKISPKLGDIFYSPAFFLINKQHFLDSAVKISDNDVLTCSDCDKHLGEVNDGFVSLWYYSIKLSSTEDKEFGGQTHPLISSVGDNFAVLLEATVQDSGSRMPRIVFKTRGTHKVLKVWVMDKDLTCYTNITNGNHLAQDKMMKLAFEEQSNGKLESSAPDNKSPGVALSEEIEVYLSEEMYSYAVRGMQLCCQDFPQQCRTIANMQCAYISLRSS
eukprot:TRINITY_DN919_c0_g1_i7.p1 TRINITY_DN919_c0_g1~~TRINITY_DN919_c0_g1_i7.p1  ORF type:complete len:385 (+),score=53.00 TRINITY_DN919_c0_g1_i7:27-1181(+)